MAENPQEMAREIVPVNIEDELKQSYMDYAMPEAGEYEP